MKIFNKKLEAQYNEALKRKAEQAAAKATAPATTVTTTKATTAPTATAPKTTAPQAASVNLVTFKETQLAPMSRAEFNAMSPRGKSDFSKAGGRIVN